MDEVWTNEPDQEDFESHGLKCRIRRVPWGGHLCGYVGVPQSHPWFGKDYDASVKAPKKLLEREINIEKVGAINLLCAGLGEPPSEEATEIVLLIDVHGGLTYAENGVEHLEGLWVFGFDCAHSGDLCPVTAEKYGAHPFDHYRDFAYVRRETESLARQLSSIAGA